LLGFSLTFRFCNRFKAVSDGNVWMKVNQVEWKPLPSGNFCIDGAMNFPITESDQTGDEADSGYSGEYSDTIVLFCGDCTEGYSFCEVRGYISFFKSNMKAFE
jgi:hypothetical protein